MPLTRSQVAAGFDDLKSGSTYEENKFENEDRQKWSERKRKSLSRSDLDSQSQPTAKRPKIAKSVIITSEELRIKDRNRKSVQRAKESTEARTYRLQKMNEMDKVRRSMESEMKRNERLKKKRGMQTKQRAFICSQAVAFSDSQQLNADSDSSLSETRKEYLWRLINQNIKPRDDKDILDLQKPEKSYEKDLTRFRKEISVPTSSVSCAVCGLRIEGNSKVYNCNDRIFSPLRESSSHNTEDWPKYAIHGAKKVSACSTCIRTLQRKSGKVPKFSRANIRLPDTVPELKDLSFVEQMLISPVLPMVCLWRYKTFGQYQSKGQCVAFYNQVQEIAKVLPRTLSEVVVNIKDAYCHSDINIHTQKLRKALVFLKNHHPAYENIEISEQNLKQIEANVERGFEKMQPTARSPTEPISREADTSSTYGELESLGPAGRNVNNVPDNTSPTAAESVRNVGQNQVVEEKVAQTALTAPLTIEASDSRAQKVKTVTNLFGAVAKKDRQLYTGKSASSGWELMFPCLLWNGKGSPDNCIHMKVSLRDWINYVIRVQSLQFHNHVIFLSFANIVLRRQRITGLTAHKPISSSVEEAVKELVQIAQSSRAREIPENTLTSLARKIGVFMNELPGSLSDMRKFRNDILSMMKKHGPPSYFLTLSSADSMWPEGFVEISNGSLSLEQARHVCRFGIRCGHRKTLYPLCRHRQDIEKLYFRLCPKNMFNGDIEVF